jgi:hypothetical protein
MEQSLHSPPRRSVSANILNLSLLGDLSLLTRTSGEEHTLSCLCALCYLAYGCSCVSQAALSHVKTLLTLATKSTAFKPIVTSLSRTLDVTLDTIVESGLVPLPDWSTMHPSDSTVGELSLVSLGSANLLGFRLFGGLFLERCTFSSWSLGRAETYI